jgi:integrase
MMKTIDIHNARRRIECARINIQKRFSEDNAKTACRFLDRLRLDNKSHGRIANYAECIRRILEIKDDKKIQDWSKEEIEQIHKTIADADYANSVKKDTLLALKRICHFAIHDEIADAEKGKPYDPLVDWITPGSFENRFGNIQPKDLLTDEEVLGLIQAAKKLGDKYVKRNIAIIFVLLEGAYRPGELLNIQIGGIEFEENFVRIHTAGKTGPKSLTLVASYNPIKEWLAEHPYGDDPEAFLFYHDNENGLIPYQRLSIFLRKAKRAAGIKKRVWPYLFRHTALTEYSKRLGNVAKIYGNWSKGSNMLAVYEHLASSDQEDAVLRLHNLKKEDKENSILFPKICPACKQRNSSDKSHCVHCGCGLSKELVQVRQVILEKRQNTDVKVLERRFSKKIKSLESLIIEQRSLIKQLVNDKNK